MHSMTGYGVGENAGFRVEIRSVNHRHLDVHVRLPAAFSSFENAVKARVRENFSRGRVDIFIKPRQESGVRLSLNRDRVRQLYEGLCDVQKDLGISGTVEIGTLALIREVYDTPDVEEIDEKPLFEALDEAMRQMAEARKREGEVLSRDLNARVEDIARRFAEIGPLSDAHRAGIRDGLMEKIQKLGPDIQVEEARLAQEILFYAERADITEELVRAQCHLDQFRSFIRDGRGVGRKLDFMSQEILREANTVASKTGESRIAHLVVEIKDQLEKVREQLQNIE